MMLPFGKKEENGCPQVSWISNQTNLKKGINKIDGRTIQGRGDLNAYLSSLDPKSKVSLEVWRAGELRAICGNPLLRLLI